MAHIATILRDGEDPFMPDLRRWLMNLSGSVAAASNGFRTFDSLAALRAYTPAGEQPRYAFVADGASFQAYLYDGADWIADEAYFEGAARVVRPFVEEANAAAVEAGAAAETLSTALTSISTRAPLYTVEKVTDEFSVANGFGGVAVAIDAADLGIGRTIGGVTLPLQAGDGAVNARITFRIRSTSSPNVNDVPSDAETLRDDFLLPLTALGLEAGGERRSVTIDLPSAHQTADGETYLLTAEMQDASGNVVTGFGRGVIGEGKPPRYAGYYRGNPGAGWSSLAISNVAVAVQWLDRGYRDLGGLVEEAQAPAKVAQAEVAKLTDALTQGFPSLYTIPYGTPEFGVESGFGGMAVAMDATDLGVGKTLTGLRLPLQASASAVLARVTVWQRPLRGAGDNASPGTDAEDALLFPTYDLTLAQLGLAAGGERLSVMVPFPNDLTVVANKTYVVAIEMYDAGGNRVVMGFGRGIKPANTPDRCAGFYRQNPGAGWSGIPTSVAIQVEWVSRALYDLAAIAADTGAGYDSRDRVLSAKLTDAGRVATITDGSLLRQGAVLSFDGAITHDAPSAGTGRYDMICLDPEALTLSVIKGGGRSTTDAAEYAPTATLPGAIPLYSVRVEASAIYPVPLFGLEDGILRSMAEARRSDIARGRRAISDTLSKAMRGEALTVAIFTDSIGAWEANEPATITPNGQFRDRPEYLSGYSSAFVASLPRYDHGDGAGAVHVHASKYWSVVEALKTWGSTVTVLNFGSGGTTSGTGRLAGTGRMNAREPERLNAVLATNPDLMLWGFGMNELGAYPSTQDNTFAVMQAFFAQGADVMVFGCPRPQSALSDTSAWKLTNRSLRRAAETVDPTTSKTAAFVDVMRIYDDPALGALGMPAKDLALATAGTNNHPGYREHQREGREAAAIILGEV